MRLPLRNVENAEAIIYGGRKGKNLDKFRVVK